MATTVRRAGRRRVRIPRPPAWTRPTLAVILVIAAVLGGGLAAMTAFRQDKRLSVGTVTLSTTPFHRGALDLYVPLVDWGVRFRSVRFPARIHVDVKSVNRTAAARIAGGADVDGRELRSEADKQIGGYLLALIGMALAASSALFLAATLFR